MASKSKVNVRFVVTLSLVLGVVVSILLATGYFILSHSGAELESMGDRAVNDKDFKNAITYYGKAYSDDQTNIQRLTKYCDAMLAYTPENQSLYQDYYWRRLIPAKLVRANLLKNDVAAQHEMLDIFSRNMYESGYDRHGWDRVIDNTNTSLAAFEAGAQGEGWQKLKRFRALALLEIASNEADPLQESEAATLESDLATVLAMDPDDERVALAQVNWCSVNAAKAAGRADTAAQADWLAKGKASLDAYRAAHPDSVAAAVTSIANAVDAAVRDADPKKFSAEQRLKMMRDAAAKLEPELAALFDIVRRVGPETLESGDLYRINRLERFVRNNKDDESVALIDQAIAKKPAKADLRFMAGRLAEDRNKQEDAIAQYDALLALPIPTLSLDGIILYEERLAALARKSEAAMGLWESLSDAPEWKSLTPDQQKEQKAKALNRITAKGTGFRDKLALEVPPSNLALLLIDAKIAYASDQLPDAKRLLESHLQQTNQSDPESVRLAGIVAMRLNQPGIALGLFERLIELQPNSPRAKLLYADVLGMLERHREALAAYQEVLGLDPENDYAKEKVGQLTSLIQGTSAKGDPVENVMLEADRYWTGKDVAPDRDRAVQILEQALGQVPNEVRIMAMLATYYYNVQRIDEAKALCARGLAIDPNNDRLKQLKNFVDAPDQYTALIGTIDNAPISPIEKLIAKVRLAQKSGKPDEAKAFLDQAVQLAPNDPNVIEFRFTDAITNKRLDEAATLADQAAAADLDKLKGATFKGRLLVAEGKKAEAIEVLKSACQGGMATPEVWRFLGQVQSDLGEETSNDHLREDALASLNEALRMRPNDLGTTIDTLKTLVHLNRYEPALDLARKSEALGRGNAEFVDLWLRLEASVGDKKRVLDFRRSLLRNQPTNDSNKLALLQTDVELGEWAEARALLDDLRAKQDSLLLVQLDARWHSDQGDRDGARTLYLDYIAAQRVKAAGAPLPPEPFIALAQFLMGIGDTQGGLAAIEEARQYQNPKTLDVDRTLGMMLFDLGALEQAVPVLEKFLAAGVPDNFPTPYAVRARHAEALLRLGKFAEAEASLDAAGPDGAQNMTLMLLRASARQNQKDNQAALKLINDAIARYPNEPLGYVKRAELVSNDAAAVNDAIADLDTAIRLRPDLWNALLLRANLKIRVNRQEEAMEDLKQVVDGNPAADGPRTALLQALIEGNEFEEAVETANKVANRRPRDLRLLMGLGDFFSNYGAANPDALIVAQRFYDRGWKLGPDPKVAIIYTRSLLRTRNSNLQLIEQILTTPQLNTAQNPELLMNHAVLLNRKGAFDQSRTEAAQALGLVITSPGDTSAMLDQLAPVFGDPFGNKADLAALIAFVQSLDMTGLPDLWADFFRARFKILDPLRKDEALGSLRQVVAGAKDPTLQKVARQFLSAALIGSGDRAASQGDTIAAAAFYEEAVQVIVGALQIDPNNAEALNNGAYVLTENLKRPAEGLPMAEKAVQIMPGSGPFWDTLGLCYLELGRLDEAENALNKAIAGGGSMDDRMQLGMKLIRVKIGKGDKAAAQKILDNAKNATDRHPDLKPRYQGQLDSLQKDIDNLK